VSISSNENAIRYPRQFAQIRQMVEAQAGLNAQAYSQTWMQLGGLQEDDAKVWDYPLAAAQEVSEFIESWGYAWWATKKWPIEQALDLSNCMTELVDAWHFILSQALIEEDGDAYRTASCLLNGFALTADNGAMNTHRSVLRHAKKLSSYLMDYAETSAPQVLIYSKFFDVLTSAGFSLDHFHARYSAKLQLNIFRQLNGYKDKPRTYEKNWNGNEDNFHLAQWIDAIFADVQAGRESKLPTEAEIMKWIAANYYLHTNKSAVTPAIAEDADTE
jgi:hypothetical protein